MTEKFHYAEYCRLLCITRQLRAVLFVLLDLEASVDAYRSAAEEGRRLLQGDLS